VEALTEVVRQELLLDAQREACLSALGSVVQGVGDKLVTCEGEGVPDLSQLLQQLEAQRKSLNPKPFKPNVSVLQLFQTALAPGCTWPHALTHSLTHTRSLKPNACVCEWRVKSFGVCRMHILARSTHWLSMCAWRLQVQVCSTL